MKMFTVKVRHIVTSTLLMALLLFVQSSQPVAASRFGQGLFGGTGSAGSGVFSPTTNLSISLGGNVSVNLSGGPTTFTGQGSHTIQVTTNDVVGYQLYVYSPTSTNMVEATGHTIPASANGSAAPLVANTWGYNTTGSTTNYIGMTTSPKLLKNDPGYHNSTVSTPVYYGVSTDITQASGIYNINVIYTLIDSNE